MDRRRVAIVIPALNEAATIGDVVASAKLSGVPVVIDDHSVDDTAGLASEAGAIVVTHARTRGYDDALASGFARAPELGCEYDITMDADWQHDPALIDSFVDALDRGADVVVGVRDRRQRFGEHVFSVVGRLRWRIRDPLCGIKGYRITVYNDLGHFDSYRSIGTELTIFAARGKRAITQIAVATRPRIGTPRFGNGLRANGRILRSLCVGLRRY
jgi:glycosyltransferase involved in cell wall biosynthesis